MPRRFIYPAETSTPNYGKLRINVTTEVGFVPIEDASISISYTGEPDSTLEVVTTNDSGQTEEIELPTPPIDYSQSPTGYQPYSEYTLSINVPGYRPLIISGVQLLPTATAIQNISLQPEPEPETPRAIVIGPHRLYGDFPPKIPEAEVKVVEETGEIVLNEVVVPEFIIVHDGPPNDPIANNYYVRFKDYIKNVASSEIYATWNEAAITANILAILSFTLNRVYTEWYRSKLLNFTITSSTAYDHKWVYGRNIYDNISRIVDSIFINYLSRPNIQQPILTQYCDGRQVQCPGWMTLLL